MSKFYSYINSAKAIVTQYKGETPLHLYLKNFFSKEKKYGSRDRKTISSLCYNYYRLGFSFNGQSVDDRLLATLFLFTEEQDLIFQKEQPDWNSKINLPLRQKLIELKINTSNIFPFNNQLSPIINIDSFNASFLIQPDVYVRTRPGKHAEVKRKLAEAEVQFCEISQSCIAVANGTKLETLLDINKEAVIQDLNSQRVAELLPSDKLANAKVWDCCAASGGKSIMVYDVVEGIRLTVSDIRQSIIYNLQKRLKEAGIKNYQSFVADVTNANSLKATLGSVEYELVICDAPCSGSGTWGRTPEQLLFFKEEEIARYQKLQKAIAMNAMRYVVKNGYFLYITCSVFRMENEDVVEFIQQRPGVKLVRMELLKGYDLKADTMFTALFQREE